MMSLDRLNADSLHLAAIKAVQAHHNSESNLLEILSVAENQKYYLEYGVPSLYQYCVKLLGRSEATSYALIAVIHKSKDVPEIMAAVQSGRVSLSKAKKICSVVNSENFEEWIALAECETSRVIEKCVAQANPKEMVRESAVYKTEDLLEFKLGVSEEWIEALAKVKDLLSQKESRAVSSDEALLILMKGFIEKSDPILKAERAKNRKKSIGGNRSHSRSSEQFPGTVGSTKTSLNRKRLKLNREPFKRSAVKRAVIHEVVARDRNRCAFTVNNRRCEQKRWLDIHHIVPVASGGTDELQNLTTLCRNHHKLAHRSLSRVSH